MKAFEKFHPLLIQQLCYYSYFENLEKGVTRMQIFFIQFGEKIFTFFLSNSLSYRGSWYQLVRYSQWKCRCLYSIGKRKSSLIFFLCIKKIEFILLRVILLFVHLAQALLSVNQFYMIPHAMQL